MSERTLDWTLDFLHRTATDSREIDAALWAVFVVAAAGWGALGQRFGLAGEVFFQRPRGW